MRTNVFSNAPQDADPDDEDDYEITYIFRAEYRGTCTINREHEWRRGQKIGRVVHASNPMLPVQGYACADCVKIYPRSDSASR